MIKPKRKKRNPKLNPEPAILFAAGLVKKKSVFYPHITRIVCSGGGITRRGKPSYEVTEKDLIVAFKVFEDVETVKVLKDNDTG